MPKICYVPKNFGAAAMEKIRTVNAIIEDYVRQGFDLTLRQLYYQMVSRDYIANNLNEYKNLGSLVNDARLGGYIDWDHIVDRVRHLDKRSSWKGPGDIIESAAYGYHKDYWKGQKHRVEVWIEKNALTGVIGPICYELDLPSFACIGYTSQSEMWSAAQRLRQYIENGQTPVILHLGDHDPSGKDMTRDIQDRLDLFLGVDMGVRRKKFYGVEVDRLALNWDQIQQYGPPPNPAKITDSRAKAYIREFGDESWELDALDPTTISNIIRKATEQYIDQDKWREVKREEAEGKMLLEKTGKLWDDMVEPLMWSAEDPDSLNEAPEDWVDGEDPDNDDDNEEENED